MDSNVSVEAGPVEVSFRIGLIVLTRNLPVFLEAEGWIFGLMGI